MVVRPKGSVWGTRSTAVVALTVAFLFGIASCAGDSAEAPVAAEATAREAPTATPVPTPTPAPLPSPTAPAPSPTQAPAPSPTPTPSASSTPTPVAPPATPEPRDRQTAALYEARRAFPDGSGVDFAVSDLTETGPLEVEVCAWLGTSVVSEPIDFTMDVEGDAVAGFDVEILDQRPGEGPCLNFDLVRSALVFLGEWEGRYRAVLEDPTSFGSDPWLESVMGAEAYSFLQQRTQTWSADGLRLRGSYFDGSLPGPLERELVWRQFGTGTDAVLSLVLCRRMDDSYGLYNAEGALVDASNDNVAGNNSVVEVQLQWQTPDPSFVDDPGFRVVRTAALVWSDCLSSEDWAASVTAWNPAPVPFEPCPPSSRAAAALCQGEGQRPEFNFAGEFVPAAVEDQSDDS